MIDKKELRIGSLVLTEGVGIGNIVRVNELHNNYLIAQYAHYAVLHWKYEEVKPLKIDHPILSRIGFDYKDSVTDEVSEKSFLAFEDNSELTYIEGIIAYHSKSFSRIKYIHQLQNLLCVISGKDYDSKWFDALKNFHGLNPNSMFGLELY